MVTNCPDCGWVMPLSPKESMVWCPCGWNVNDLPNKTFGYSPFRFDETAYEEEK